jgi:hypothetical protein
MARVAEVIGPPGDDLDTWAGQVRRASLALLRQVPRLQEDYHYQRHAMTLTGTITAIVRKTSEAAGGQIERGRVTIRADVGDYNDVLWTEPLDTPEGEAQLAAVQALGQQRVIYTKTTVNHDNGGRGFGRIIDIAAADPT